VTDERAELEAQIANDLPFLSALGWAPIIASTGWIINHLEDVESDLSAFHRIDDYTTMTSTRFFALATRLAAYRGVVRTHLEAELHEREERRRGGTRPASRPRGTVTEAPESVTLAELEAEGFIRHRKGRVAA
jgi:hypothetical protein